VAGPAERSAKKQAFKRSRLSRELPLRAQGRRFMYRPFLGALTPLLVLTLVATAGIAIAIRLFWRRGKSLEDL
jgi:hypothetical protein